MPGAAAYALVHVAEREPGARVPAAAPGMSISRPCCGLADRGGCVVSDKPRQGTARSGGCMKWSAKWRFISPRSVNENDLGKE